MKALIIDEVYEGISRELGKYMTVDTKMLPTQEELANLIGEYDVLIMRVDPAINKEILDAAKNLKVIGQGHSGVQRPRHERQRRGRADSGQDAGAVPPHHPRRPRRDH